MATKKTNTTESKNTELVTEAQFREAERNISRQLKDQPKIKVMIAPDEKDPVWRGWLNGYPYSFPKRLPRSSSRARRWHTNIRSWRISSSRAWSSDRRETA